MKRKLIVEFNDKIISQDMARCSIEGLEWDWIESVEVE